MSMSPASGDEEQGAAVPRGEAFSSNEALPSHDESLSAEALPADLSARAPGPDRYVRYYVVAALCMAAIVAYVQRNSISVAEEAIRTDLDISKGTSGLIMSAFFLTYGLCQLSTGWLAKIYGTRRALFSFAVIFSVATQLFALGRLPFLLLTARLGMGATQSGIFPCCVNTVSKWLPTWRHNLANGLLASSMSIGGAAGTAAMGALLPLIGWQSAYLLFAAPGFIFALAFYVWFRDRPQDHPSVTDAELAAIAGNAVSDGGKASADGRTPAEKDQVENKKSPDDEVHEPTPWLTIASSPGMWALCGQQIFRAAGYIYFATWFGTYLRETRGVGDLEVGLLNSLPLIAVVVGSPLGGAFSDWLLVRTGNRRISREAVAAVSMLLCALLIVASYPVANPWLAVLLISGGSFWAAFGGPASYTATIDMGGRHVPMVFSIMNASGCIGAFLFPLVVPWLLRLGTGGDPDAPGNWPLVMGVFAGIYLGAALCWMVVNTNVNVTERRVRKR